MLLIWHCITIWPSYIKHSDSDMAIYYLEKTVEACNTKEVHPFYIQSLTKLADHYFKIDSKKSLTYTYKLSKVTIEHLELYKALIQLNEHYQVQAATHRIEKENKGKQLAIQERNNLITYIDSSILFVLIIMFIITRFIGKRRRIDEILEDSNEYLIYIEEQTTMDWKCHSFHYD